MTFAGPRGGLRARQQKRRGRIAYFRHGPRSIRPRQHSWRWPAAFLALAGRRYFVLVAASRAVSAALAPYGELCSPRAHRCCALPRPELPCGASIEWLVCRRAPRDRRKSSRARVTASRRPPPCLADRRHDRADSRDRPPRARRRFVRGSGLRVASQLAALRERRTDSEPDLQRVQLLHSRRAQASVRPMRDHERTGRREGALRLMERAQLVAWPGGKPRPLRRNVSGDRFAETSIGMRRGRHARRDGKCLGR